MIAADPDNPKWRLEGVYAATNLGGRAGAGRYARSRGYLPARSARWTADRGGTRTIAEYLKSDLEALAYLCRCARIVRASSMRPSGSGERQLALLAPYLAQATRPDAEPKGDDRQYGTVDAAFQARRYRSGLDHAATAVGDRQRLVALEPTNADWIGRSANTQLNQALASTSVGPDRRGRSQRPTGCEKANRSSRAIPPLCLARLGALACRLRAELACSGARRARPVACAQVLDGVRSDKIVSAKDRFALAQAHKLVGDILWRTGDVPARRRMAGGPCRLAQRMPKRPAKWRSAARCCAELVSVPKECGSRRNWRRWDTASH